MRYCKILLLLFASLLLEFSCFELKPQKAHFVTFENSKIIVESSDKTNIEVELIFNIKPGYHIQSEIDKSTNLIATEFSIEEQLGDFELLNQVFEYEGEILTLEDETFNVISNTFKINMKLNLNLEDRQRIKNIKGVLFYQTCDDKKCYFPRILEVEIPILKIHKSRLK